MENSTQDKIIEFIKTWLIGTISSRLIIIGVMFIGFGFWDVFLYCFNTSVLEKSMSTPGESFGWPQAFGLVCFILGFSIKLYFYLKNNNSKLKKERLTLKENYSTLSDAKIQDEFERLYQAKNIDIQAIKNILNHPHNKNMVIELYRSCYRHVTPKGEWFIEKGKYLNIRYYIGYCIWCFVPIMAVCALIISIIEWFNPGISNSGPYATQAFLMLGLTEAFAAWLLLSDLIAIGRAVTLVQNYKP